MTIKVEAFLALEASLVTRLENSLAAYTAPLYKRIEGLISAGDTAEALRVVQGLSLEPVFEANKSYIEYVTNLAMLFGASRVTKTPGTSVVGLGFENITVQQIIQTFRYSIVVKAEQYLKTMAVQLIAQDNLRAEAETIHKEERVLLPFASFMDKSGKTYFNTASSLHTSRVSAYGFTAEAFALGFTEYQLTEQLDNRTCPVCAEMHGKVFKVSDARRLLDIVVRTQNPDDLQSLQPWPSQSKESVEELRAMTPDQLVSRGWHIPPFHPRCRGLLTRVGKAPALGAKAKPTEYVPSVDEFKALGHTLTEQQLEVWRTTVGMPPAEFISRLKGQAVTEFLAELPLDATPAALKKASGLQDLAIDDLITVKLKNNVFGSAEPVTQAFQFSVEDKTAHLQLFSMAKEDESSGIVSKWLKSFTSIAQDADMAGITLKAGGFGGYAWAKYGFSPLTLGDWDSLKAFVATKVLKSKALVGKSPLQIKAYQAIMASDDPMNIFALADIPELGKELLAGSSWMGWLDLNSPEAMTRYLTFIGK